jgi:catechol-2,3-dioxygenase
LKPKRAEAAEAIVKTKNILQNFPLQKYASIPTDTIFICHVHMQIRDLFVMFMSAPK